MLCQLLPWDTDFFGMQIARVCANRLDNVQAEAVTVWCRANRVDCLYFLADTDDAETIRQAEEDGYRLVDIRLTLEARLGGPVAAFTPNSGIDIGPVRPAEVGILKAIARESHHDSRFYQDPGFRRADCDRLYEVWIERACSEPAGTVLVARRGSHIAGYLACGRQDARTGRIALVAIAAGFQRQGIGQALVSASLDWFSQQEFDQVSVVTQGRNVAAQRLYQRAGFMTQSMRLWYHRWFQ